jgi:hypothetical protein
MDPISVPAMPPEGAALSFVAAADEDEVPLGWECAAPALQIERWGMDDEASLSGNS